VTNKYLPSTSETKRLAQDKMMGAILPTGLLSQSRITSSNSPAAFGASDRKRCDAWYRWYRYGSWAAGWTQIGTQIFGRLL